jgi:adenylate kinase family enzyme
MERIVLLGRAGSGKTTLARNLSRIADLPVISLDEIWQPGWSKQNVPAFRTLVREAHAGDKWVSDGNFAKATFDIRLPRATLIIWLEHPPLACALRAVRRVCKPGERHRIRGLADVFLYIWRFDRVNRPLIEGEQLAWGPSVPVKTLRGNREIAEFLRSYASP